MSVVLMKKGTKQKMIYSDLKEPCVTFEDVNTLFVWWVGVWVVWRCENPTIDVADPCATVVLVRALAAMITLGVLKQNCREQKSGWVIELGDQ